MTDQKGEDGGTGQALHFEPGSSNDLVEDTLLTLEINLPSPAVLSQVPRDKYLEFLHGHRTARTRFRRVLLELADKVKGCDPNQVQDMLRTEKAEIEDAIVSLRSDLESITVLTASNISKVALPAIGAGISALAMPSAAPFTIGAGVFGVGMALVNCCVETKGKLKQAKDSSPYYYLLSLRRQFGP